MTIKGSNNEVAHAWAYGRPISNVLGKGEAYRSSHMSRNTDGILFSYQMAIGNRINDKFYLVVTGDLTTTTASKHFPSMRRAIPYAAVVCYVPNVRGSGIVRNLSSSVESRVFVDHDHIVNLKYLLQQIGLASENAHSRRQRNSDVGQVVAYRIQILMQYYRQFRCFRLLAQTVKGDSELRTYYKALLPFFRQLNKEPISVLTCERITDDPRLQAAAAACLPLGLIHHNTRLTRSRSAAQQKSVVTRRVNYQAYLRQGSWILGLTENLQGFDSTEVVRVNAYSNRWNHDPVFDRSPSDCEYFQQKHAALLRLIQPLRQQLASEMPTELAAICRTQFENYDPESLSKYNQFHCWSYTTCKQLYDFRRRYEGRSRKREECRGSCCLLEQYVDTIRSWPIETPERITDERLNAAAEQVRAMVIPDEGQDELLLSPEWISTDENLRTTTSGFRAAIERYEHRLWLERNVRDYADKIRRWRQGENVGSLHSLPIMLRIKDDQIQSSLSAAIPIRSGQIVWPILLEFHRTGDKSVLSQLRNHAFTHFKLDVERTTVDQLCIGCHMILWAEVELIAQQLNIPTISENASQAEKVAV